MNIKHFILSYLLLGVCCYSFAQKSDTDTARYSPHLLSTEEFQHFQLPSLETLFENAKKNPRIAAIQASIEAAKYDTKLAKRDWWSFFSLRAGYNYGILGTYIDHETEYLPLTTTYSGSTQSSWQIGANINVPLDNLINRRLKVKKQQQLVESAEFNQEIAFNEIKAEIIELYGDIQYQLKMLKLAIESVIMYEADYNVVKSDFINNKISTSGLTELKNSQKKAQAEYELIASRLNIYLLKLEVLTNTPLIHK